MKILVVAATFQELSGVFRHFNLPEQSFSTQASFDVLITGVGMTATAFSLGRHLSREYELVLNLGIAGSFNPSLSTGTLVNITEDHFAELGAEDKDNFLSIEQLGLGESVCKTDFSHLIPQLQGITKVKSVTVNRVHGSQASIVDVSTRLSPDVESMEGAAVFYSCSQLNIPAIQLRCISNAVEPRNKEKWQIGLAIKNLNDWALGFLTNI